MTEIVLASSFRRAFKRRIRGNKKPEQRFRERVAIFQDDPFDPRLRTHQLSGQLEGLWSFSVDYDARVIFSFDDSNRALLIDIGTHEEVY